MPDVVIIGGGLSGLAAASELQALNIPYTLIEVKNRLGGSIATHEHDGFRLDNGVFTFSKYTDWSFLETLGLEDALFDLPWGNQVAFKKGTQVVIDALAQNLTGTFLHKMALSSLGEVDGRFALCMENGLMLDARAIIVAAPARHVERMFRTFVPEVSLRLMDYGYDSIIRVALGYRTEDIKIPGRRAWGDVHCAFYQATEHPDRAPAGHTLVQLGMRYSLDRTTPEALMSAIKHDFGWPEPLVHQVSKWAEADPLPPHTVHFRDNMQTLESFLPDGVALAGSDYAGLGLGERIASGRAAARKIAGWLGQ